MIQRTQGNLLEANVEALVNTVNCVGVMGKGIALQFKKKFPEMFMPYKKACDDGGLVPGVIHIFEREDMLGPRYLLNFPTKRHWKGKSRMDDVEAGLDALAVIIEEKNIKSIAIPPLGCGNGGLEWSVVSKIIDEKLSHLDSRILVYAPEGAPEAKDISHNTECPKMNSSRAICLKIWHQYFALGYQLTLLEVHKLLYFLQEAGQPLRLRFEKGRFGPYADNLRHVLNRMEGHFITGFGDGAQNKPDTPIIPKNEAVGEADAFLSDSEDEDRKESLERLHRVARLIEGFESPYGMELLSTVHWVVTYDKVSSTEEITDAVFDWNARKKKIMKPDHIDLAHRRLKFEGWVS